MKKNVKGHKPAISPVMRTVSTYIATALKKPLPAKVTEVTKHHLLDTLAAMVSGSRLLPGERALAYVKAQGGASEACVPGSRIVTTVVNAALAGGMLAHAQRAMPSRQGIVELTLRDGRRVRHHTKAVRGTCENPMSRAEVDEKCFPLLAPVLGRQRARRLIDTVWRLERVRNVRTLRRLLTA